MIEEEGGDSTDEQHADRDDRGNPPTLHDPILAMAGGFARARWRSLEYVAPSSSSASAKYRLDTKIFRDRAREIGPDVGDGLSVDDPVIEPIPP